MTLNKKEIILAQICDIYGTNGFVICKNGQLKRILRCCGLGEYYEENSDYLEPYWYNKTYENENRKYNVFIGLDNIFSDLLSNNRSDDIILLLTELGKNIPEHVFEKEYNKPFKEKIEKLQSLYKLMGLNLEAEHFFDGYGDSIQVTVKAFANDSLRFNNNCNMEEWLEKNYPNVYDSYESALDSYTIGDLGASIESCRTTLTGLFSKFKGIPYQNRSWFLGLATITGDFTGTTSSDATQLSPIKSEIENLNKSDISDFFGENLNGSYKKTKAIYSIYSMLSDYGTHREEGTVEVPTSEDALMMIRMTTDILVWIYQKNQ